MINNLNVNNLNRDRYIISEKLHFSLEQGKFDNSFDSDKIIYLVMVKVLNYENKSLVYNYISYSHLFTFTLTYFLVRKNIVHFQ